MKIHRIPLYDDLHFCYTRKSFSHHNHTDARFQTTQVFWLGFFCKASPPAPSCKQKKKNNNQLKDILFTIKNNSQPVNDNEHNQALTLT